MILLIGATSFLGAPTLEKLLQKSYKVKCMVRSDSDRSKLLEVSRKSGKEVIFSIGSLQSEDSIFNNLKDANSVIYLVDLENTYLVKNFLRAAKRTGLKRAVFISSTTVLLPVGSKVKKRKLKSEELIKNSDLDYTILRPTMIYGSPDDGNFSRMINFIKRRGFFVTFGSGSNLIQPIYIQDVADAIVGVLENKKTYRKVYQICGRSPIKYIDMLKIVQKKLGRRFKIIKLPLGLSKFLVSSYSKFTKNPQLTPDQVERMKVDKTYSYQEAKEDFGFSPLDFEKGIEKLIEKLK